MCRKLGWLVNVEKSELEPKQVFDFVGYPFDLRSGRVRHTPDRWQNLQDKILEVLSLLACPVRQFMSLIGLLTATEKQVHLGHLHMRPVQWHLRNNWRVLESLEKIIPIPRSLHQHLQWWLDEDNVLTGQPLHPIKHALQIYRRIKRSVGHSLKRAYCKKNLVPTRKQAAYKLPRTQSGFLSPKRVQRPLHKQDSSCRNRQYHGSGIHKQGRRHEIGPALRTSLEDLDLVYQKSSNPQSPTYLRPAECSSRQAIQARPNHSDRVVPPPRGFSDCMQQVAPTSSGLVCHEVQQQVTPVCVTGTRSSGHGNRCAQPAMGGSGCLCLPASSHLRQSGGEVAGHPMQENHSNCPGVAEHTLVLGSASHVQSNPIEPAFPAHPFNTTFESDPSQKFDEPKSPCLAPRATAIKKQGFSKAVAERIEAPQRGSTRSVYEAKWTIFTKWCSTNQVDFRAPPLNSVADFLLYLFQDRKLQPSTIDGYRSAIADKLGNSPINISKDENLTRLLDSFHRDMPKAGGEFTLEPLSGTTPADEGSL